MTERTFVDQCLEGDVEADDIDEFVDAWHQGAGGGLELREYLGMTAEEYALWVEQPSFLPAILEAHRFGFNLSDAVQDLAAVPIAARALDPQEAGSILSWLKETGRV